MTSGWIKASASGGDGGECVEMRRQGDRVEVRDSKDRSGPVLRFEPRDWAAMLDGARCGLFDSLS